MPAAQVEPDDGDETFERIVDFGHGQQRLRVRHEATTTPHRISMSSSPGIVGLGLHALCNPFQHRSRLEDKGRQHDPAQVGSGTELRDDVGEDWRSHRKKVSIHAARNFPTTHTREDVERGAGSTEAALTIALLGLDDGLILGARGVGARLVGGGAIACVVEDTGGPVVSTHGGRGSRSRGNVCLRGGGDDGGFWGWA